MDGLAAKLDEVSEQNLQSPELGTIMTSESSIARCCQILCLLCCTEDAFERSLDKVAHSIKKFAITLNKVEEKLEGNAASEADVRNIQDQVIYTIGVVAYRLIKEQATSSKASAFLLDACKAGHTVDLQLF